jgi:hypothetical protein
MKEFHDIVRPGCQSHRRMIPLKLNQRATVLLRWLQKLKVRISRLRFDVDAKAALDLLPRQGSLGTNDEAQDTSCQLRPSRIESV